MNLSKNHLHSWTISGDTSARPMTTRTAIPTVPMYWEDGLSSGTLSNFRLVFERIFFSLYSSFRIVGSLELSFARSSGSSKFNCDEHLQTQCSSVVLLMFVGVLYRWEVAALAVDTNAFVVMICVVRLSNNECMNIMCRRSSWRCFWCCGCCGLCAWLCYSVCNGCVDTYDKLNKNLSINGNKHTCNNKRI